MSLANARRWADITDQLLPMLRESSSSRGLTPGPKLLSVISELDSAFDHLIGVVRGMDNTERMADSNYFGRPMTITANIVVSMGDMHEHLGQLIAYARTNEVVPPWSR